MSEAPFDLRALTFHGTLPRSPRGEALRPAFHYTAPLKGEPKAVIVFPRPPGQVTGYDWTRRASAARAANLWYRLKYRQGGELVMFTDLMGRVHLLADARWTRWFRLQESLLLRCEPPAHALHR